MLAILSNSHQSPKLIPRQYFILYSISVIVALVADGSYSEILDNHKKLGKPLPKSTVIKAYKIIFFREYL